MIVITLIFDTGLVLSYFFPNTAINCSLEIDWMNAIITAYKPFNVHEQICYPADCAPPNKCI